MRRGGGKKKSWERRKQWGRVVNKKRHRWRKKESKHEKRHEASPWCRKGLVDKILQEENKRAKEKT